MAAPEGVTVRQAGPGEAEALTRLHLDCWDDAYTGLVPQSILDARRDDLPALVARWRARLANRWTHVAEHGSGLIGFVNAAAAVAVPEVELHLYALYVRAPWWGTGVGHALFTTAVGDRSACLWVLEGNDRAIRFYQRRGFRLDGVGHDEAEGRHLRMVRPAL